MTGTGGGDEGCGISEVEVAGIQEEESEGVGGGGTRRGAKGGEEEGSIEAVGMEGIEDGGGPRIEW